MNALKREAWFLTRDRAALLWLGLAVMAAAIAVWLGLQAVSQQRATISDLIESDRIERGLVIQDQKDWGSAAYYQFHLTYDEPSDFAFAALGQRDVSPWKHRIRMLALEGQIYETDNSNPDFALIGRFDFAFVASLLAPLLLILILHDQRSRERAAGRLDLLESTARAGGLWRYRSLLRTGLLWACLVIPLWIGGVVAGSSIQTLLLASVVVLAYLIIWWIIIVLVTAKGGSSSVNLVGLMGVWVLFAVIAPAAIKAGVNAIVPVPDGGSILLTQREAVNDAWDLPKDATWEPFVERHPEFAEYAKIEKSFEWKWYYAFQQVGDQKAESLSLAYREGRQRRDQLTGLISIISPTSALQRYLEHLAHTDTAATFDYESRVRRYHGELRSFYYPKLFKDQPFELELAQQHPVYTTR